jgi:hypothetical protein
MVMDLFDSLLNELSTELDIPSLKSDSNNSCLIKLPENGAKIQLEFDKSQEYFVIASNLGFIPRGRYREIVFKEALRHNNTPHPRNGTFCYSDKNENLVLMELLPLKDLTGVKIADVFTPFSERATAWKQAIEKGEVPQAAGMSARPAGSGMFGL